MIYLFSVLLIKESPRYLQIKGDYNEADKLAKFYTGDIIHRDLEDIDCEKPYKVTFSDFSKYHCQFLKNNF